MNTWSIRIKKHNGTIDVMAFPSEWQARYYLYMIPYLQVAGNEEAMEIARAKIEVARWVLDA